MGAGLLVHYAWRACLWSSNCEAFTNTHQLARHCCCNLVVVLCSNERTILAATLLRVLFIPAFHFAAVSGAGPAVIGALTLLLGVSNGYLTGCAMVAAPSLVPPANGELAGNMMVLFLILGLCIGAGCGFLWLL